MKLQYTTKEDQNPAFVRNLITKHKNGLNMIVIHLNGYVESNLNVIKKYEEIDDKYCRIVDETYLCDEISDVFEFLDCMNKNNLFCVLFNKSITSSKETPYYPTISNYKNSNEMIKFNLFNKYELSAKYSRKVSDDFHYEENLKITIIADKKWIYLLNLMIRRFLVPSPKHLNFDDLNINAENSLNYGDCHIPININEYIKKIDIDNTDILVTINGISYYNKRESVDKSTCCVRSVYRTKNYHHNEVFKFQNIKTLKKFLKYTPENDDVPLPELRSHGFNLIKYEKNEIMIKLDTDDDDEWRKKLEIRFYCENYETTKKIFEYLKIMNDQ